MAEIVPFRGVLYQGRASLSPVLAPPYDVIDEAEREALAAKDPRNCVRLILPQDPPGTGPEGRYAEAGRLLCSWLGDGTLRRDGQAALYRYAQVFTPPGAAQQRVTRRGFITLIRLHRFDERVVLPHERTLAGPKADRLKLMRSTRAHFSQVFGLYRDPGGAVDQAFAAADAQAPHLLGTTADGVEHHLWRVDDPATVEAVVSQLRDKRVYIADGHHRYETMIALREELRRDPAYRGADSAAEYGSIFLCNASDPGLLVFPTHRVVHGLPTFDLAELLRRAEEHFVVEAARGELGAAAVQAALQERGRLGPAFLVATAAGAAYLMLRPEAAAAVPGPEVLQGVDVTVLHALIFEKLLGLSRAAQEAQTHLRYLKDTGKALKAAAEPGVQAVFLMNPTPVEQVLAAADAGEVMPQKSTYFYPKLASGLVMNLILPAEAAGSSEAV